MQDKKTKIFLIINPVSGTGRKNDILSLAGALEKENFELQVEYTSFPGHAKELALQALSDNAEIVAVAGGDGTINEAAGALINTRVKFGIIPTGSGNGLSRHLNIPLNVKMALQVIRNMHAVSIDAGMANGHPFFCTAGMGFDAHIGNEFLNGKSRGLYGYVNHVIREYFRYQPHTYSVEINGSVTDHKAFIITVANAGQYGNNAFIAPHADISDGYLDLCIVKDFPRLKGIGMSLKLFMKTISKSPYYSNKRIRSVKIDSPGAGVYHLDGEIFPYEKNLEISVLHRCLEVIVPGN